MGETPQALAERCVHRMLAEDRFTEWMGMEVVEIAPQRSVVTMVVRPEMTNGFGVCHGGVTFSLADSALAFASNTHSPGSSSTSGAFSIQAVPFGKCAQLTFPSPYVAGTLVRSMRLSASNSLIGRIFIHHACMGTTSRSHLQLPG